MKHDTISSAILRLPLLSLLSILMLTPAHAAESNSVEITYSPAQGIGAEAGVMRRDPSDIVRVGEQFYVWYSKGKVADGYDATVWYATSPDGKKWTEKGESIARGPAGSWDEQSAFTPNILVAAGKYWLAYTAVPKPFNNNNTKTAIGFAKADSPDGPWVKLDSNPILRTSEDNNAFDSFRVDDACFIVRDGKYWFYYKGRQMGKTPTETKMGLAIATKPEGPYLKHGAPIIDGGHEVTVWPYGTGVMSLVRIGPAGLAKTIQYAPDGLTFSTWQDLKSVPIAAGLYRPEAFTESGKGTMPTWGVHIGMRKPFLPFIERITLENKSATPHHPETSRQPATTH